MKFKTILIVLLSMLIVPAVLGHCVDEIKEQALELKGDNDLQTMMNIDWYVESRTNNQFYYSPRNLCQYWYDMSGDCTERANLKVTMLNYAGIRARTVRGYVYEYEEQYVTQVKHDWYEIKYNNHWISMEGYNFPFIEKKGNGIW